MHVLCTPPASRPLLLPSALTCLLSAALPSRVSVVGSTDHALGYLLLEGISPRAVAMVHS